MEDLIGIPSMKSFLLLRSMNFGSDDLLSLAYVMLADSLLKTSKLREASPPFVLFAKSSKPLRSLAERPNIQWSRTQPN